MNLVNLQSLQGDSILVNFDQVATLMQANHWLAHSKENIIITRLRFGGDTLDVIGSIDYILRKAGAHGVRRELKTDYKTS